MCDPLNPLCTPAGFPAAIASAVDRFDTEVHLGKDARTALYKFGSDNHGVLAPKLVQLDGPGFEEVSAGLHERLKVALVHSKQRDAAGRAYYPARIDAEGVAAAFKAEPWED